MIEILQNSLTYIILGILYIGASIYFVGLARHNNNIIAGFGVIIMTITLIYSGFKIVWWFPIIIFVVLIVTQSFIPHYLGYFYWKVKYKPKFLTKWRFGGLIFEQYQKLTCKPILTEVFIDKYINENGSKRNEIEEYSNEIFETQSKFIGEEIFSDYKIFVYYIQMRKEKGFDLAIHTISRDLGVAPMTSIEMVLKVDEISQEIKNRNRK